MSVTASLVLAAAKTMVSAARAGTMAHRHAASNNAAARIFRLASMAVSPRSTQRTTYRGKDIVGGDERSGQDRAIMTSVDLMTAVTSSPTLSARSSTESTKIAETTLAPPPTSTVTWAMTAPFLMAVILPL